MEAVIQKNLVYLTNHLSNLSQVLANLIQEDVISITEKEMIETEKTSHEKNSKLFFILKTKDWNRVGLLFLEILRKTNNKHCAEIIEEIPTSISMPLPISSAARNRLLHPKMKSKWWPDIKPLIKSLHKRKFGSRLLVEELYERILADENRMVVLCESADAEKLTGMGGVGKTLTAKWYAHHYEKEYDHILWVDCGEGSLLHSFKKLAMELKIDNWDKYIEVEDYSRLCFQDLSEFKCLWIFDNAENYKGKEGIINVVPINRKNFFCLITSRSREWGVKDVGHGNISELELDIFSEQESVEFFKSKLRGEIKCSDLELRELSRLLGNLPMAMELALATFNGNKMTIRKYMKKLRHKDLRIVDVTFDKYEERINQNIKISIENIREEKEAGELAMEILSVFAYVRPDDIPQEFIQTIFNTQVEESIDLLVKYSLISKENKNDNKYFLSIHRLLQQVIRHNGRETETEILKKTLGCEGFIDYKLIPFTKYADKELQKEFPKVKAELLDQQQLLKLMREKRFDECLQLAKFIDSEMKTNTTKFNFAICLHNNRQDEEYIKTLNELNGQELKEEINYVYEVVEMGLLQLQAQVSLELVGGHLLLAYLKTNKQKATEIVQKRKRFKMMKSDENLDTLIRLLHSDISHYKIKNDIFSPLIELTLDVQTKTIELRNCSLWLDSFDRLSPEEFTLKNVKFFRDGRELKQVKVNDFIHLPTIKRLTLNCYKKNELIVELSEDVSIDCLQLQNVEVLNWTNSNWTVKELELWHVPLMEKTNMKVQEMTIVGSSLDVSCLPQTIHKINLYEMKMFVSGGVQLPHLKQLKLKYMDVGCLSYFPSAPLTHISLHYIRGGEVNVDLFPPTLTNLKIKKNSFDVVVIVGGVRRVHNLILEYFSFKQVEGCLTHFHTDNLLIYDYYGYGVNSLMLLMKKAIKTIALGEIKWYKDEFKNYSSHLDRQSSYYLLEGESGKAMKEEEFKKRFEL